VAISFDRSRNQNTPIPVFSAWRKSDDLQTVASILRDHDQGVFSRSATFVDELMTDDRIQGVLETRIGELISSPFKVNPATDKRKARKVAEDLGGTDGYSGEWEMMVAPTTVAALEKWGIMLGVAVAGIEWIRTPERWTPRLVPWHPANLYWDDWRKTFVMNTMQGQVALPRPDQQPRGDGSWVVWCPYGVEYGWRDALIRSLGDIYLSRRYASVDFNRWTEKCSRGLITGKVPAGTAENIKAQFRQDLGNTNSDSVVICERGSDGTDGYDVDAVNLDGASGTSWNGIKARLDDCNANIAILILGGDLNTEAKGGGSYAAANSQRKTHINRALRDASLAGSIGRMMLSHWADANYNDAALAPLPCYEVVPGEDEQSEALALKTLGDALQSLVIGSGRVDAEAILEGFGVPMISEEELAAREEEAAEKMAEQAEAMKAAGGGGESGGGGEDAAADPEADPKKEKERAALGMLEGVRKRLTFAGLGVAVENPAGTVRQWNDGTKSGHTVMKHHYGFLEGYLGKDKEELDVYLGEDETAEMVYIIAQNGPVGVGGRWCHDEDKVMLGFRSAEEAQAAFLVHRDDGGRAFGGMKMMTVEMFKSKLRRRGTSATTKLSAIAEVGRELVALAQRARGPSSRSRPVAGSKRAAKYTQAVMDMGKRRAARALAPDLAALKAIVDSCENLSELKPRILKAFRGMDPTGLARVVQKCNILANLAGRGQALEEV
jgi:phage gp29-like protein